MGVDPEAISKVESDKCPFCDREAKPFSSNSEDHCHYVGDLAERLKMLRSPSCYEAEITNLKALVREMVFADYTQFTEILDRPQVRAIMEGSDG